MCLWRKLRNFIIMHYVMVKGEIFPASHIKKYETVNSFIWLINPNEIEINIDELEKLDNVKNYVYEINGVWACIIKSKHGNQFRAITSINNELPWYYSLESNGIIANNIFLIAKYLDSIEMNFRAVSSFLAFDFCYAGETYLKKVKKSYGGDILYISNESIKIVECDLQKWLGFDESISDRNLVLEAFLHSVNKSLKNRNARISITGGSDSRAILAAALASGKDFSLMTGTSSTVDRRDIRVADLIAKLTQKKHYRINAGNIKLKNLEDVLEEMAIKTNVEFTPRNWLIFYKEYALDSENQMNVTLLQGYRGEIFKGFYKGFGGSVDAYVNRYLSLLNNKYKTLTNELIQEKYSYYKNLSGINADELFYHRERDNFWASCSIKTRMNYCKVCTPFSDNELLSLAYRFNGGIKESKLHESVFSLLPKEIKNLPTSSNRIGWIYNNFQKRFKKQQRHSSYLKPDFLQKKIEYELLSEIIPLATMESLIYKYNLKGLNSDIVHKMFAISYFYRLIN